jgi:threonyl-tRNA synthetase
MDQIHVTLPDGKVQEVPKGTTPADIARKISPRLADAALVARITPTNGDGTGATTTTNTAAEASASGELIDLRRPLEHDVKLQILTDKDADALYVFRHSAAHLLAAAVTELFPDVKLGIGPPIDTGFFYEFLREQPFTPEDLAQIEKKMRQLAAQDLPNVR